MHIPRCMHKIHKSCVAGRKGHFGSKTCGPRRFIEKSLPDDLVSYKSIHTVCNANEAVNYPQNFWTHWICQACYHTFYNSKLDLRLFYFEIWIHYGCAKARDWSLKNWWTLSKNILNGKFKGENVLLPRIPMIPTDVPIEFKRVQVPIRLAFTMTIIKLQSQMVSVCG